MYGPPPSRSCLPAVIATPESARESLSLAHPLLCYLLPDGFLSAFASQSLMRGEQFGPGGQDQRQMSTNFRDAASPIRFPLFCSRA